MRIPEADIVLANGLRVPSRGIPPVEWHDHVVRHPLGFDAVRLSPPRPWNSEGWDDLDPPVASEADYGDIRSWVDKEKAAGRRCVQLHAKKYSRCRGCQQDLFRDCELRPKDVSRRYADVIQGTLRTLAQGEGVVLSRTDVMRRLLSRVRERPDAAHSELVSMTFGSSKSGYHSVARASRGDGVSVELYLNALPTGHELVFRTAFRERPHQPVWGVLMQHARARPDHGVLSEMVLVSRRLAQVLHV